MFDAAQEVGAGTVHLVDERNARYAVLVHLPPDRFGLRLDARHGAVHGHSGVEHAQASLDFNGEVDVARGVDNVDAVFGEGAVHALPERGGSRGGNGDTALLLLLHVVHDSRAVVDLTDFVRNARIEQDTLGGRGLSGIDVR